MRVADTRISPIPVATSVNRVYRIPDRPINWLTEPGTRLALCNRGAPSFSFQGVGERQEGERTSSHNSFAYTHTHTHTPPSTTCGYERVTLRILLSGCSHRRSLRRLLTFSHTSPQLIVLPRCTDYARSSTLRGRQILAPSFTNSSSAKRKIGFNVSSIPNSFRGDILEARSS